ncbi:MAG TPA: oligosaccharide flippase family protein [Bacteroidales bacterium]|nr:oligosaccharide flippase family protein [Bacteroidales bacterium]
MFKWIENLYRNYPRLRQVASLFAVNLVIIPLSIVSNIFITRFLGPVAFGDFKFMTYIFSLAMVIFTFGFFQAGNRAIVLSNDKKRTRELYGSMVVVLAALFVVMCIALVIYTLLDRNISEKGLRTALLIVIPFTWIFLLMNYFEVLFQADNKISLLGKSRLYPKLIFLAVTLLFYLVFAGYKGDRLLIIWIIFFVSHAAGFLYILYQVHPLFSNMQERLKEIFHFNKTYGFNVYVGTLFNVAMNSLSGLLISYFGVDNSGVGYFSLAMTIAEPLSFIPNVIATTHYKEFASKTSIAKRLTLITVGVSVFALVLCWILVGPFINIFYGAEFRPVIYLTFIGSIGIILHGTGDYYNRFMGSHGRGKALRNSAIIVGIVLFICNFTLIPLFGETGAAYTKILAGLTYLLSMLWYYKRLVKQLTSEERNKPEINNNNV